MNSILTYSKAIFVIWLFDGNAIKIMDENTKRYVAYGVGFLAVLGVGALVYKKFWCTSCKSTKPEETKKVPPTTTSAAEASKTK